MQLLKRLIKTKQFRNDIGYKESIHITPPQPFFDLAVIVFGLRLINYDVPSVFHLIKMIIAYISELQWHLSSWKPICQKNNHSSWILFAFISPFWGRFEASDLGGWHGTGWYDLHAERNNSPGRKGVPGLMRRGRFFISVSEEKAS